MCISEDVYMYVRRDILMYVHKIRYSTYIKVGRIAYGVI